MKKRHIIFAILFFLVINFQAQCAPVSNSADSTFEALIDTSNSTIHVTANLQTFLGIIPVPHSCVGYHIAVDNQVSSIAETTLNVFNLSPNPVEHSLIISNLENAINFISTNSSS